MTENPVDGLWKGFFIEVRMMNELNEYVKTGLLFLDRRNGRVNTSTATCGLHRKFTSYRKPSLQNPAKGRTVRDISCKTLKHRVLFS